MFALFSCSLAIEVSLVRVVAIRQNGDEITHERNIRITYTKMRAQREKNMRHGLVVFFRHNIKFANCGPVLLYNNNKFDL